MKLTEQKLKAIFEAPVADGENVYWSIVFGMNDADETVRRLMVEEIVRAILSSALATEGGEAVGYVIPSMVKKMREDGTVMYPTPCGMATMPLYAAPQSQVDSLSDEGQRELYERSPAEEAPQSQGEKAVALTHTLKIIAEIGEGGNSIQSLRNCARLAREVLRGSKLSKDDDFWDAQKWRAYQEKAQGEKAVASEDARDAERYRWLKNSNTNIEFDDGKTYPWFELDAAIDEAIAGEKK